MKKNLAIVLLFAASCSFAQSQYKGLPVIKTSVQRISYSISGGKAAGWNIDPAIPEDTLPVYCFQKYQDVIFRTNSDSIKLNIASGQCKKFYIQVNEKEYALTAVFGIKPDMTNLTFNNRRDNSIKFWYDDPSVNVYLINLRRKYNLDDLIAGAGNDTEKALRILSWVHKQWNHNGNNEPQKNDAISILEEVKATGKGFRCVEYGIVATACLSAVGIKARVVGLKTKDAETRSSGAGHVLLEAFLNDRKKWVLMDGQWDVMPFLNRVPLNAVEFQQAIINNYGKLEIKSASGTSKDFYINWVHPYLNYFDVKLDNREGITYAERNSISGKKELMLVPGGQNNPRVFQGRSKLDYFIYTNSLSDFYKVPD